MDKTYILHVRPFQDSSAILDCFSEQHGVVGLVGKGVKRPRSKFYGLIQPFLLLNMAWVGKGDLKTLTQVEADNLYPALTGPKLFVGMYLNEIMLRLLQRFDPHPELFWDYDQTVKALGQAQSDQQSQSILRCFELRLLMELGYALNLDYDNRTLQPIQPDCLYGYDRELGLYELQHTQEHAYSGASIIALKLGQFANDAQLREAKHLMRVVLGQYLGPKPLESRKLFTQFKQVEHE